MRKIELGVFQAGIKLGRPTVHLKETLQTVERVVSKNKPKTERVLRTAEPAREAQEVMLSMLKMLPVIGILRKIRVRLQILREMLMLRRGKRRLILRLNLEILKAWVVMAERVTDLMILWVRILTLNQQTL